MSVCDTARTNYERARVEAVTRAGLRDNATLAFLASSLCE